MYRRFRRWTRTYQPRSVGRRSGHRGGVPALPGWHRRRERGGHRARSPRGKARPGSSSGGAETPGGSQESGSTRGPKRARPVPRPFPPSSRAGRGGARPSPLPLASVPLAELSLPPLLAAVPARLRSGPLGHFLSALKSVRRWARVAGGRLGQAAAAWAVRAAPRCRGGRGRRWCTLSSSPPRVPGSGAALAAAEPPPARAVRRGRGAGGAGTAVGTGTGTARAPAPPCGRLRPGSPVRAGSRAGAGAARSRPAPRELEGGAAPARSVLTGVSASLQGVFYE